jgi:uncharacterized protein (TIGR02996 family)
MSNAPHLEAQLALHPDDTSVWQVYADWLLERGEPWAPVIADACAGRPDTRRQTQTAAELLGGLDGSSIVWKHGVVDRLVLASERNPARGTRPTADALARVLAHPAGRLVRELVLGLPPRPDGDIDWNFDDLIPVLARMGPLPRLELLDLSKRADHMDQRSWRRVGDLRPLWAAAPRLRTLVTEGASGSDRGPPLLLHPIEAPHLETVIFRSGGLDREAPVALGQAHLPSLRHLELWFGRPDYGNNASLADLSGILSGRGLPALQRLGLCNSEWEGELIDAIAESAVLPRLHSLDLSRGILCREGAARLLARRDKFAHLHSLDLDKNYILEEDSAALQAVFPQVDLGLQRELDGDFDDEYSRYTAAGE